ncbi:MAG: hypothetical protein GX575_27605 [Candidatus Anammoximicrobium sp.]|nr:hypothetical protein [Candidatus Anammoximicrobium sp.]
MNDGLPDFSGKLVFVNFAGGGECHQLLADPRFEDQGGQLFLVGTVPANVMPGFEGRTVGVSWRAVEQYFVFDSAAQYMDACSRYGWACWRAKWISRINWLSGRR